MEEYRLVNRALKALGVDVKEDSDIEDFQAKDVERADTDKLGPLQSTKVSSLIADGKAGHVGEKVKLSK